LQGLTRAADLFASVHERTAGIDGFVSLELSSLLAYDTKKSVSAAKVLHRKGDRPNLFIKIPGTSNGVPAIEESNPLQTTSLLMSRFFFSGAIS